MSSEAFKAFSSVDRIFRNVDDEMLERSYDIPLPPNNWPKSGNITAKNVSMRYRSELPLVLKNVSFNIKTGEKVGIVGRTGSGKSSLILLLTRLIELDEEGPDNCISIDGIPIDSIGLGQLRKNIKIIPQDPYLIEGTLRENMDPFNHFEDDKIIAVLEKCLIWNSNLFDTENKDNTIRVSSKKEKLNFKIEGRGNNL